MVWEVNDDSRGNLFLQQYHLYEYMTELHTQLKQL